MLLGFKHKVAETGTESNETVHALSPLKKDTFIAVADPNMSTYQFENKIHPKCRDNCNSQYT
jgi:hypothetical protein